jgi:CBS domain-containing protein
MNRKLDAPVSTIMSRELLIVKPHDTLERVRDIFASYQIHHIPVVGEDGRLSGILSKTDFSKVNHLLALFNKEQYAAYNDRLYQYVCVEEIMTKQVTTLNPGDPLSLAAEIFLENLFHAIPVVDKGVLIGLITTYDLLSFLCREPGFLD